MANILLVEPDYRAKYTPLGLQKIATYHLQKGDKVRYIKGVPSKEEERNLFTRKAYHPDKVYITSMFTYDGGKVIDTINKYKAMYPNADIKVGGVFASLMPDYVKENTGIRPHIGLLKKVEKCIPNFSCFPDTDKSILFTTRGCPNGCEFCAVKCLEQFSIVKNWKKHIDLSKRHIVIQDNNILSVPWEHQVEVVNYLATLKGKRIEFNGGFDCYRFKEQQAKLYSQLRIDPARFAFDQLKQDGYIQRSIELAKKYKIGNDLTVYVLYNFNDKPEDFYYRAKEMVKINASAYPMRYTPLDYLHKKYVGKYWTEQLLHNLNNLIRHNSWGRIIIFGRFKLKDFNRIYGKNEKEFVEIISSYHTTKEYKMHKKKYVRKEENIQKKENNKTVKQVEMAYV